MSPLTSVFANRSPPKKRTLLEQTPTNLKLRYAVNLTLPGFDREARIHAAATAAIGFSVGDAFTGVEMVIVETLLS